MLTRSLTLTLTLTLTLHRFPLCHCMPLPLQMQMQTKASVPTSVQSVSASLPVVQDRSSCWWAMPTACCPPGCCSAWDPTALHSPDSTDHLSPWRLPRQDRRRPLRRLEAPAARPPLRRCSDSAGAHNRQGNFWISRFDTSLDLNSPTQEVFHVIVNQPD